MFLVPEDFPPSPVPSDSRLLPGELPFTVFGQFGAGKLDIRVFDQDSWWVDRWGCAHELRSMSSDYRANVLNFLYRYADEYHHATIVRAALQAEVDIARGLEPLPCLDAARINAQTPAQWLESTVLVRGLRALAGVSS